MRALAQSLGREFGPQGVHVAHAIIDGVIDIPRTKEWKLKGLEDEKISSEAVSELSLFRGGCQVLLLREQVFELDRRCDENDC